MILIPTTSGTGSEVSDGLVMSSDDHMKHGCLAVNAMAEYAIVDPELMVTMPPNSPPPPVWTPSPTPARATPPILPPSPPTILRRP